MAEAANSELAIDIPKLLAEQDSTYTAGKLIDKYAYILLTISEIVHDSDVTASTLTALKQAFHSWTTNNITYPLMYDTKFQGITSSASLITGDIQSDYGAPHYNDHHFHYGYWIHAAAVVGYIDAKQGGSWAEDNKEWVNALIRDVANPSDVDGYFPVSRSFDWFHGHSWASGLTESGDGLNEESTSEDYNCYYGMKLWGSVIGDKSMQFRGDLMLAIMKRSLNDYMYYKDDNEVISSKYIGNKVAGITFQNKLDYATYFGTNTEYIHGIHMLPITAASGIIREHEFVQQEWDKIISKVVDSVDSGWLSILRINQALIDPSSSYAFYSDPNWDFTKLDNGQSRTWGLAFSAGVLNAS
ncbi:unnamed protein product [Ambrosiozyma monospora]|uniref:Unnamed protein product n=2 Tax=Ambrosiozyma monospora TaxID=43982 RepID=A0ACB5U6S9_AMBMO|nr:unnamed protein product [Ambrosiozyma monospora]